MFRQLTIIAAIFFYNISCNNISSESVASQTKKDSDCTSCGTPHSRLAALTQSNAKTKLIKIKQRHIYTCRY